MFIHSVPTSSVRSGAQQLYTLLGGNVHDFGLFKRARETPASWSYGKASAVDSRSFRGALVRWQQRQQVSELDVSMRAANPCLFGHILPLALAQPVRQSKHSS